MSEYKGAELLCELHYGDEFEWPDTKCPVCRLTERIETLSEALRPFAAIETMNVEDGAWVATTKYCNNQVTAFSVRKARAALNVETKGNL